MVKLLIADDEPLVCVGIQSILNWSSLGIEIVSTARNGNQALEMIEQYRPEIVITDIKMPLKTGLELAEECGQRYGRIPLFIFLTSYEEFEYVRMAIKAQAVDYLIKLELSKETLTKVITKTLTLLDSYRGGENAAKQQRSNLAMLRETFFMRLYNNLFDSEEQYEIQKTELELVFDAARYTAVNCKILPPNEANASREQLISLCNSTVQMIQENLSRNHKCYITTLDTRHFCVAFCLYGDDASCQQASIYDALQKAFMNTKNYFNVSVYAAIGYMVEEPRALSGSYLAALRQIQHTALEEPIQICENAAANEPVSTIMTELRGTIREAFEEMDTPLIHQTLTQITAYYADKPGQYLSALDAACNIMYMAVSLLPDGEKVLNQIFADEPEGYRSIYRLKTTGDIVIWLSHLRDGCCAVLSEQKQSYRQQIVKSVQEYIQQNLNRRLALSEVAAVFNFSPSYLSQLFSKCAGESFVEYTTSARIDAAKQMLRQNDAKVYEVSEKLGFESAFYFSKVFKKVVGVSPKEYSMVNKLEEISAAGK